jgi:GNAT superfamily N-acetyltransferase
MQSFGARRVRPTDRGAVLRMHTRCSRQTRYSRWLAPSTNLPRSYLRSLMAGTADHIAVVALADCQPGAVIGLASAALRTDGRRELGMLVEDRYQAQGVGRLMLDRLIELLDPKEPICAYALTENRWLLGKLARLGTLTFRHDSGLIEVDVDRAPACEEIDERKATRGEI